MKPQRGLIKGGKGKTVANAAKMIAEAAAAAIFIEVKGIHPPPPLFLLWWLLHSTLWAVMNREEEKSMNGYGESEREELDSHFVLKQVWVHVKNMWETKASSHEWFPPSPPHHIAFFLLREIGAIFLPPLFEIPPFLPILRAAKNQKRTVKIQRYCEFSKNFMLFSA